MIMDAFRLFLCPPKYRVFRVLVLCAQVGEVDTNSDKMLAVPDPWKVWIVASALVEIDFIIRSGPRF